MQIYLLSDCGQPTKGCHPTWGLSEGLTPSHRKKQLVTKRYTGPRIWTDFWNDLGNGK